jgi:hypothetical protein
MISQLFSISLRAVIVAATFPTPPALGAVLLGPNTPPGSTMIEFVANRTGLAPQLPVHLHPAPASANNPGGR